MLCDVVRSDFCGSVRNDTCVSLRRRLWAVMKIVFGVHLVLVVVVLGAALAVGLVELSSALVEVVAVGTLVVELLAEAMAAEEVGSSTSHKWSGSKSLQRLWQAMLVDLAMHSLDSRILMYFSTFSK